MIKNILHPGNGIDFPKKGDYIKFNLEVFDKDGKEVFNSANTKGLEVRFNSNESFLMKELEDLIGEMSLFEKCSLEIDGSKVKADHKGLNESIYELLQTKGKLIFEVEIVNISKISHF